jgi:hypothetical protein
MRNRQFIEEFEQEYFKRYGLPCVKENTMSVKEQVYAALTKALTAEEVAHGLGRNLGEVKLALGRLMIERRVRYGTTTGRASPGLASSAKFERKINVGSE